MRDEHDVAGTQLMAGGGDALLHLRHRDRVGVGLLPGVDSDARGEEPIKRQLVDRRRGRSLDRRVVVPRRVDVGAGVSAGRDLPAPRRCASRGEAP